jgi:hypothetical protein
MVLEAGIEKPTAAADAIKHSAGTPPATRTQSFEVATSRDMNSSDGASEVDSMFCGLINGKCYIWKGYGQ